jgi:hypothetical protein
MMHVAMAPATLKGSRLRWASLATCSLPILASVAFGWAPAHADPAQELSNDDKFMNMVRSVGITPSTGAANWIAVGHSMCGELSAGRPSPSVAIDAANGGLPQIQANDVVDAAIQFYCPQFKNEYVQPHN